MPHNTLSRPDASEYKPYYETYIALVANQDVLGFLKAQIDALEPIRSLSDSDAAYRYEPDKWSVKEVIGHVTDAERIFAYRMLRIGRGDATPLATFDQQPYVDAGKFNRFSMTALIDAFRTARVATLSVASELDDEAWLQRGTASGFPVSARALAFIIAGHAAHHISMLRDRYGVAI